jgi:hypothetical protein
MRFNTTWACIHSRALLWFLVSHLCHESRLCNCAATICCSKGHLAVQVCDRLGPSSRPAALPLLKVTRLSDDVLAANQSSVIIPFEVKAGDPAAIHCSGTLNGDAVVLGACKHKELANSVDAPKFRLCLQVTDRSGMLCEGEKAKSFLCSKLPEHSLVLEWGVRTCNIALQE